MKVLALLSLAAASSTVLAQPHPLMQEYNRAWQLIGRRRPDDAIPILKQIIEKDKGFYRAYSAFVEAYYQKKDLAKAEEYLRSLLVHDPRNGLVWGSIGLMTDTSIALSRIILSGILDEFPKLKLVCPHGGGVVPYLIGRIDHQAMVLKRGAEHIKRPPSQYLQQVWMDAVSPYPPAIRYAYDFVGPDRLMYASDHPWVDPKLIAACVEKMGLSAADERKIFAENAKKLFRL